MSASQNGINLNLASTLQSTPNTFEITAHDDTFPTISFNQDEAELFERQFNDLISEMGSSVLSQSFLKERENIIANTAAFAKQELDDKVFGGINAGDNQIGFSMLKPGHIYRDSGNTLHNDWYFEPGVTGGTTWSDNQSGGKWVDWIGDGSSNNYTVGEDQVSVVLGFVDQDVSTEVSAINVDEFGRNMDMLPTDMNNARLMDNDTEQQAVALPSLIAQDNDNVHIKLRYDKQVESQPRLFGVTFGLGSFLNTEDY